MSQVPDDEHYRMMAKLLVGGAAVPFLGAGVNLCGRPERTVWKLGECLPSGSELAEYLAREVDYPYQDRTDLLRVSQYVDVTLGNGPLYESLRGVFAAEYPPTPLHRLLASLPALIRRAGRRTFPLIVTTNYDDALERAFLEAGEPYDLATYIADGPDRGRFKHTAPSGESKVIAVPNKYTQLRFDERPVIAKIHGAVNRCDERSDSFVVTENHYIAYLSHTDVAKLIPVNLLARMSRSHFLFLGYSLRDWNLRVILHRLWGDGGLNYNSWAIQADPDRLDQKAWARRGVELLDARLEAYGDELGARLSEAPKTEAVA